MSEDSSQSDSPKSPKANLLERVLRQSLEIAKDEEQLDSVQMDAMMAVAHEQAGTEASAETVQALVGTVLMDRFKSLGLSDEMMNEMSEQIAAMLMEDPVASERVQGFWNSLTEAVNDDTD